MAHLRLGLEASAHGCVLGERELGDVALLLAPDQEHAKDPDGFLDSRLGALLAAWHLQKSVGFEEARDVRDEDGREFLVGAEERFDLLEVLSIGVESALGLALVFEMLKVALGGAVQSGV